MKRRDFLIRTAAGATATVVLESCGHQEEELIPMLVSEQDLTPGAQVWVASLCRQCPAGCGITVKTMQGETTKLVKGSPMRQSVMQAKKIEGNPAFPLNQGRLCARGQAGLQVLYNPDRIKTPLKLVGSRGSEQYQPISWEEAIGTLAAKLKELRQHEEPQSLLCLTGRLHGHTRKVVQRFMEAFGSPNHVTHELFSDAVLRRANLLNVGHNALPAYDLENVNYLISFSAAYLETFLSPVRYSLGFGHLRQGRPGRRAKVVQVEPRMSLTAAKADEWLPAKPGTEGVVAMGLAHVIIQEGLYDKESVARSTTGFEDFKALVLQKYQPETVAQITDVPAERLKRIAREFARHQPGLAIGGDAAAAHPHGLFTLMAVHALNALVGNFGRTGGIQFSPDPPLSPLPPAKPDKIAQLGLSQPPLAEPTGSLSELTKRLRSGSPYPIKVILLADTNPVFSSPDLGRLRQIADPSPFVVSFSSFMDESTKLADLILPDHTYLESWWDETPDPGVGFPAVGIAQPVVKPIYDTRSTPDVLMQVAKEIGGAVAEAFPWADFTEVLKHGFKGLFEAKRGSVVVEDFDSFWEQVLAKGGWWDPTNTPAFKFKTPSGKFEFKTINEPVFAPTDVAQEFPFFLHLYQSLAFSDGRGANQPWLQEMPDPMTTVCWGSWVEINPRTAETLGVQDNDLVWIGSPLGQIEVPVLIFPGARPDTINMPVGQGHEAYGRYAQDRGANPVKILAPLVESQTGAVAYAATKVKVYKAERMGRMVTVGYLRQHSKSEGE
jgi:anaerobic selenocysteine-containing dehydrogenase